MILMNDFASEPEDLRGHELAACERSIRSGRFILGSEVQQFERDWAKFCGASFSDGSGNEMDALELGLSALDIGRGHEVITTHDDGNRHRHSHHAYWRNVGPGRCRRRNSAPRGS